MNIGQYTLPNNLFVAPMAGVTDRPFRMLCKKLGAGYAVSEMVTSKRELWSTLKTSRRANHDGESAPVAVQIAGTSAEMMAEAAMYNIDNGAQIIDTIIKAQPQKVITLDNLFTGNDQLKTNTMLQMKDAGIDFNTEHVTFGISSFYNNISNI